MSKKLTTEEFIRRAKEVHGERYDYSKTHYHGRSKKVLIICREHGEFWQRPDHHLSSYGCRKCSRRYMDAEYFKQKANVVHNGKYDYSKVEYVNNHTKVHIVCPIHGEFWQTPNDHLSGKGCFKCRVENATLCTESFIERANRLHKEKYDYSLTVYEHCQKKVKIICPIHGMFEQTAGNHLNGYGCQQCANDARRKTTSQFIAEAKAIHGDKYDYAFVDYHQSFEKVKIICPTHGLFEQSPHHHLDGAGCPSCSKSQGEARIEAFLRKNEIPFFSQYKIVINSSLFERDHFVLVDFFIPQNKLIIEFNGIQHYVEVEYFHKKDNGFEKQKLRDEKLRKWCNDNDVNLLEIKYNEIDSIEEVLINNLNINVL